MYHLVYVNIIFADPSREGDLRSVRRTVSHRCSALFGPSQRALQLSNDTDRMPSERKCARSIPIHFYYGQWAPDRGFVQGGKTLGWGLDDAAHLSALECHLEVGITPIE